MKNQLIIWVKYAQIMRTTALSNTVLLDIRIITSNFDS